MISSSVVIVKCLVVVEVVDIVVVRIWFVMNVLF